MATLVGTAPNAIYATFAATLAGHQVTFTEWLSFGLPFVLLFLPVVWQLQARRFIPPDLELPLRHSVERPGPMCRGEKQVAFVFALMVILWLSRRPVEAIHWPGWSAFAWGPLSLHWINDSGVAVLGGVLLFILPVDLRRGVFTLDLRSGLDISWGTLLLFGGGLALGQAIANTGLAAWLADLLQVTAGAGPHVLLLAVALFASVLTEITSNTATATMLMPVMHALGRSLGGNELRLMSTAAVATSMAFMSPIGTPPNAIVHGTGQVTMAQMLRAGVPLNILAVILWWLIATLLVRG
jgi:sodium-dependent dicarboxylate transporter 2/3/5